MYLRENVYILNQKWRNVYKHLEAYISANKKSFGLIAYVYLLARDV